MNKHKSSVLLCWDANVYGISALLGVLEGLKNYAVNITTIVYLVCEYIYDNTEIRDTSTDKKHIQGQNAKERIASLQTYFENSSINFQVLIVPTSAIPEGDADNLQTIERAIITKVFPFTLQFNPTELHIPLTSGTQSMRFTWIALYTKSVLTRSFGENIHIWQYVEDRGNAVNTTMYHKLYEVIIDKNPFIEAIQKESYNLKELATVNLDFDGKIRRNAAIDVPMLILGERGVGKSTLIETTIVPEKLMQGYIKKTEVQTIICGQLDTELAADELFGHEKGAYTGAATEKEGKIKLADRGILFLDEIQDLPKGIQRQLLRALQNKKFNKIGQRGKEEFSDFKLVCASNNTLTELQKKLDPDFFDRIATFKSYIKPLREQPEEVIKELWNNRWISAHSKGFIIPQQPDCFSLVKDTLLNSKMKGNIRDIEQLIAYIARDVYQGTTEISDFVRTERYTMVLSEWLKDYTERYNTLETPIGMEEQQIQIQKTHTEDEKDIAKHFMEENSWKDINNLFKKWLSDTAITYFGSRKEAAKTLCCEEKTLYNARLNSDNQKD